MKIIEHFVNGKQYSGNSKRTSPVFDPATGEETAQVKLGNLKDLNQTVEKAQKSLTLRMGLANPALTDQISMLLPTRS